MTPDQRLAYLAGIVDGEGCISTHLIPNKRHIPSVYVKVVMTDARPVMLLQTVFGGTVAGVQPRKPNHKPGYCWQVSGRRAGDVLIALMPLLLVKKEQAGKAIAIRAITGSVGKRLSEDRLNSGLAIRDEIRILNKRGVA